MNGRFFARRALCLPLPVTIVTQTLRSYRTEDAVRSKEDALLLADQVLTERLSGYLAGGEVLNRTLSSEIVDGTLLVTLTAECEEEIGTFVHLPKEQSD